MHKQVDLLQEILKQMLKKVAGIVRVETLVELGRTESALKQIK